MNKKIILRWLKMVVLIYSGIGIILYYLQEFFLFHPTKLDSNYVFQFDQPFEELKIPINQTDTISLVKFFPTDSIRKGVVVYYHGNMQNIARYARFAKNFTKQGYEVWMEDYPGFGKSTGKRTEEKLYMQAMQVMQMAAGRYGKDSIIVYGKSFGTGIAAYAASSTDCKRLILETPYYNIPSLFEMYAPFYPARSMSTYQLPTNKFIVDVKCPVSIFHGTDDGVIPFMNAIRLKRIIKPTDEFIIIKKGTHHNLAEFPLYQQKLDSLLNLR